MPKVGMEPIRRRQLIEATLASIHQEGFAQTTIARVSRRAGLSGGIVAHYLDGKAGLLEATMRALVDKVRGDILARLARARSPLERVLAVIDANFAPEQFSPEVVTVWLAFWSQVPHVPALARVQRVYQSRLRSNLRHGLRPLLPSSEVHGVSTGLAALIDGLWLRCALTDGGIGPDAARELVRDYVMRHLSPPRPSSDNIAKPNDLI